MKRILLLALFCWTPPLLLTPLAPAAQIEWEGDEDDDWKTGGNWEGGVVPGSSDVAFFETLNNNCTVDIAVDVQGILVDSTYSGTLNFGSSAYTIAVGSSGVDFGGGTIEMGDAVFTVTDGDFDYVNCGAFSDGTSTLVMKGTGSLLFKNIEPLYNLTNFLGATTTIPSGSGTSCRVNNALVVNGTISMATGKQLTPRVTATMTIGASGSVTGAGALYFASPTSGGLTGFAEGASISVANVIIEEPQSTAVFVGATWDCSTQLYVRGWSTSTRTWAPSGTQTFNCPVIFNHYSGVGTLNIDGTNNPSYVFTDNVTWTEAVGTVAWTNKGTGTITFSGTAAQTVDLDAQTVEDIVVDKSAQTLTLSGGFTTDSFTFTDGSLDVGGQTVVTTGNFTVAPGCTFATGGAGLNGADITVGGNFTVTGTVGTPIDMTASAWTLDLTGSGQAQWVNVTNSDASAGSSVHAQRSTNGGGNNNWIFHRGGGRGSFRGGAAIPRMRIR